jgi:hypothetical protein
VGTAPINEEVHCLKNDVLIPVPAGVPQLLSSVLKKLQDRTPVLSLGLQGADQGRQLLQGGRNCSGPLQCVSQSPSLSPISPFINEVQDDIQEGDRQPPNPPFPVSSWPMWDDLCILTLALHSWCLPFPRTFLRIWWTSSVQSRTETLSFGCAEVSALVWIPLARVPEHRCPAEHRRRPVRFRPDMSRRFPTGKPAKKEFPCKLRNAGTVSRSITSNDSRTAR